MVVDWPKDDDDDDDDNDDDDFNDYDDDGYSEDCYSLNCIKGPFSNPQPHSLHFLLKQLKFLHQ